MPLAKANNSTKKVRNGPMEILEILRAASMTFYRADANADQQLDFDEFRNAISSNGADTYSTETVKEVFALADADGTGKIDKEEFFFWTLKWTCENAGASSGVAEAFQSCDKTGDGELNLREFTAAVERFGFGAIGHQLFEELDVSKSGTISYRELATSLRGKRGTYSQDCKRLLTAMSFEVLEQSSMGEPTEVEFDMSPWGAADTNELRAVISQRMMDTRARPYDVWSTIIIRVATNRLAHTITKSKFCKGLRLALGYDGDDAVLEQAFSEMDDDCNGELTFDEFLNWLNGRQQRRQQAKQLKLATNRGSDATPLDSVEWSEVILWNELKAMLSKAEMSALDLISAHDRSDDGTLSKREFFVMMKAIIGSPDVWLDTDVKEVTKALFRKLSGNDNELDIQEFHSWMLKRPAQESPPGADVRTKNADAQEEPSTNTQAAPARSDPNAMRLNPVARPLPTPDLLLTSPQPDPEQFMSKHFLEGGSLPALKAQPQRLSPSLRRSVSRAKMMAAAAEEAARRADAAVRRRKLAKEYAALAASTAEQETRNMLALAMEARRSEEVRRKQMRERKVREALTGTGR